MIKPFHSWLYYLQQSLEKEAETQQALEQEVVVQQQRDAQAFGEPQ